MSIQQISRFDALSVEVHFDNGIPTDDFDVVLFTRDVLSIPITAKQRHGVLHNCRISDGRLYIDISHHELGYGILTGRIILHTPAIGDIPATDIVTDFDTDFEIVDIPADGAKNIGIDVAIRALAPIPNQTTGTWWVGGQDTGIPYNNTANSDSIADSAVTTPKIADRAVTTEKIAKGAITTELLAEKSVRANNIGAGAVTSAAIAERSIDSVHLQDDAIRSNHIQNSAISTEKLSDKAVSLSKIGDDVWEHVDEKILPVYNTAENAATNATNATNEATTAKNTANAALQAVADMKIGGVNYIDGTNQGIRNWVVYAHYETIREMSEIELLGQRGVRFSARRDSPQTIPDGLVYGANNAYSRPPFMYSALQVGDEFVLSADIETQNIRSINASFSTLFISLEKETYSVLADGIAHYEWRGLVLRKMGAHDSRPPLYIKCWAENNNAQYSMSIVNLKLEKGSKSTSWTPSQYDIDSQFSNTVHVDAQNLADSQQQQARMNIGAMAVTPSGDPMHYMFELIGAAWNATSGYWEFDYLTDITTEQMRLIYLWRNSNTIPTNSGRYGVPETVRAIINMNSTRAQGNAGYMFSNCVGAELISFRNEGITLSNTASAAIFMFYNCRSLQVIAGRIDLRLIKTDNYFNSMFAGCSALREVRLYQLAASGLDLSATSVLSAESVRYLVENAVNTNAITVKVSQVTLDNIQGGADDWTGIAAAAAAKQITFEQGVATALSDADDEGVYLTEQIYEA